MIELDKIELNPEFKRAFEVAENSNKNLFITGRAGTGKSTFLQYLREKTNKQFAILAPTGVAAVNIKGQTIHSFFGFKPDITPHKVKEVRVKNPKLYKEIDAIVIDEISMVRADLFDSIDAFLRIHGRKKGKPFGGIQLILIGDLYQLPPVVTSREKEIFKEFYDTPYFFSSKAFRESEFEFVEFEKIYRQCDPEFIEILNAIRTNTATEEVLEKLNQRVRDDFVPEDELYIYLTTTNRTAERINNQRLEQLKGKEHKYFGFIEGEFNQSDLPTSQELRLKINAQVMLLNNDSRGRWINGDIGTVVEIEKRRTEPDLIYVELANREIVEVQPYQWEFFEFYYDSKKKRILSEVVGLFTQYPLRLAWAITIHKSQGLTFDKVIIDLERGTFSHGQLYVALSRCRSLNGLILKKPVKAKHILLDRKIVKFLVNFQYELSKKSLSPEDKLSILKRAIEERKPVEIVYLKSNNVKTKRVVTPLSIGEMDYLGKSFYGLSAFCQMRKEERVFNVDRILELRLIE